MPLVAPSKARNCSPQLHISPDSGPSRSTLLTKENMKERRNPGARGKLRGMGEILGEPAKPVEVLGTEGDASNEPADEDGSERRREYRLNRVLGAELNRGEETVKARLYVINISRSGLKATNHFPVASEDTQSLKLYLSTKEPPLAIEAKVAWQKELKVSGMFEIGLAFTHLSEQDYQRLDLFIEAERAKLAAPAQKTLDLESIWKFAK